MGRRGLLCVATLTGLCSPVGVVGFSVNVRPGIRATNTGKGSSNGSPSSSKSILETQGTTASGALAASSTKAGDFGGMLGDKVASAIVKSPIYPLLIKQAMGTMKKSAQV